MEQKIIKLNENNQIDDKESIQGIAETKAFVRFIIRPLEVDLDRKIPDECWKDRSLQECYIQYVQSQEKEKGLCYLTGNIETISYLHSKKFGMKVMVQSLFPLMIARILLTEGVLWTRRKLFL